jgi:hypothetical protein
VGTEGDNRQQLSRNKYISPGARLSLGPIRTIVVFPSRGSSDQVRRTEKRFESFSLASVNKSGCFMGGSCTRVRYLPAFFGATRIFRTHRLWCVLTNGASEVLRRICQPISWDGKRGPELITAKVDFIFPSLHHTHARNGRVRTHSTSLTRLALISVIALRL